ncbi:hypothetical protein H2248_005537 [Termitomyces sp. 'cryptogamus']|nr:hypothetical protein H2248_005537 [Termitomyces sp. 'cryptogamus']
MSCDGVLHILDQLHIFSLPFPHLPLVFASPMVAIIPVLSTVIFLASRGIQSVSTVLPTPNCPALALANPKPAVASPGLMVRQASEFDPNPFLSQCNDCVVLETTMNNAQNCSTLDGVLDCLCKNSFMSPLGRCLNCAVSTPESGLDVEHAQSLADQFVSVCHTAGFNVNNVTVSAANATGSSDTSQTTQNGAPKSTVMYPSAILVTVLGAFVSLAWVR